MEKKVKKNGWDYGILIGVILLVIIGVMMIFSSSSIQSRVTHGDELHFLKRQVVYISIGFVVMLIASKINYKFYYDNAILIMGINIILLILTKYSPLGVEFNQAKRWIGYQGITFQTSEYTKIANIVIVAFMIKRNQKKMRMLSTVVRILVLILISFFLVLIQPSLSASLTIGIVGVAMLFIGGITRLHTAMLFLGGVLGSYILTKSKSYRVERLMTFLDPFKNATNEGWQVVNSLFAVASGGLNGVGYGKSIQKFFYLSQPQNDFIFAVIAEELGFVRTLMIILLFVFLIFRIFLLFENTKDAFGQMLVAGIGIQIGIQMLLNIGVAMSMVPNTGIGLPFISYGGTSVIIFLGMIGVLLNISVNRDMIIGEKK